MGEEYIYRLLEGLISDGDLKSELTKRKKDFITESIHYELKDRYLSEGWEVDREFKNKIRMKKAKAHDLVFEDQVWVTFANLGFKRLNRDRNFRIPYADDEKLTQQIDIVAMDDQTILLIECKAAQENTKGNFKKDIEAIGGRKEGIIKHIKKLFPGSKHKIKFILATKNYYLPQVDQDRLDNFDIIHFDEEIIDYYSELTGQLGLAARFQLLGNIFAGQNIPELLNEIPAIEGKMGNHTYYSFSIEPEKLLTIGYILHRNKANNKMMPTYQRIVKKARLKAIQEFINNDGYFPNSIVINIDAAKKMRFERANTQVKGAISNLGVLHLPKKYRSAFIIDGQHRLYGYANSEYKTKNSIPVVAFVNLAREEQVQLFMQINENQKAVPKNLRKTLESDLLWTSDDLRQQQVALKSRIAISLGEDKDSPLYERIIVGENKKTPTMCITIDSVSRALSRANFFGKVTKDSIVEDGTYYNGNLDDTYEKILIYLKGCFEYLRDHLGDIWKQGEEGFILINKGVYSLISIFSDIIDHLITTDGLNPKDRSQKTVLNEAKTYLDPVIMFLKSLNEDGINELKSRHGSGGDTKYWRTLQNAIRDTHRDFNPIGLDEYLKKEAKEFNEKSFAIIRDLEQYFKEDFKHRLEEKHGKNWWKKAVPPDVYENAENLASKKNREVENDEDEVTGWDCLNLIDYRKIALKNWKDFEEDYTKPGEEKISGGKDAKTGWMTKLERIRNVNFHSYSVSEEEFDFLCELNDWLINKMDSESY